MSKASKPTGVVFVSYAREDRERVRHLVEYLGKLFDIWWDANIEYGAPFRAEIDKVLNEAACVVVVWTDTSVKREFVWSEVEKGRRRGVLIPILFDKAAEKNIPVGFTERHFADLTDWDGSEDRGLHRLIAIIQRLVEREPAPNGYYDPLPQDEWRVNRSLQAASELRDLTAQFRSIGEILLPGSAQSADLMGALGEVYKTYTVVNSAIMKFVSPSVSKKTVPVKPFATMERGNLVASIKNGRGHCTRILVYYRKYGGLRDWLKHKLTEEELSKTDVIFERLGTSDGDLFDALVEIGNLLTQEARSITNLLLADQQEAARKRILAGREKLEPLEKQIATVMNELQELAGSLGYTEPV